MKKIKDIIIGERLDKFLVEKLGDFSRSQLQKMIKSQQITVNSRGVSPHYFLRPGDEVEIVPQKIAEQKEKKIETNKANQIKIKTIAETNDFIVLDKPAGLIVHGSDGIKERTLTDWLLQKYPEIIKVGDDPSRPGIVHRLDKEVSGLMIVAKNQAFFDFIKKQFQERSLEKKYQGLVYGQIEKDTGYIDFPLQRSADGHKMAALPIIKNGEKNLEGKPALTEFLVKKRFINYTWLDIKIKTGRTHQIRAHFAAYGHPLVGDDLYGNKTTKQKNKKNSLGRIWLYAYELSFCDLQGKEQRFKIKTPKELEYFLRKIK